jgi:predicted PurR-regulated permease PerM/GAF domain-containing protein
MAKHKTKTASADALVGLWTLALTAFVIAALFFARDLLIPLALSALLTFLLSPLVGRIERWIGRIAAVLLVVALIFTATGGAGWILTRQLVDLATKLPEYKGNITEKLHAFRVSKGGTFMKLSETVDELKKELPGESPTITQEAGKPETAIASPPSRTTRPVPVKVLETSKANPFELIQTIITPLIGPLGTAALVFVLVIFMLFAREDLRNRLIRLIGQGRISATTHALDDAADRVSRYLRMQLLVNVTYGTCIAIGLYFIGVPNAALWGALGTVLRFIPYVGPWIAMILPTLLALSVSRGWAMPILTVALFAGIELVLNNILEPLLYGKNTGISSIALIVAAVFWTWLWGPVGLVLATPLTVCLVVMGRHVPRLSFLSVLLSDEEALTPAEDCYHRLLTVGEQDEMRFVDAYLKENSLTALYDAVLIPVVSNAEMDARLEFMDEKQLAHLNQSVRDIIDDLGTRPLIPTKISSTVAADGPSRDADALRAILTSSVYCLPARAERDELAGAMLSQLLRQQGAKVQWAPARLPTSEQLDLVEKADVDIVCISVVAPSTIIHARNLCAQLRERFPRMKIVIGLWGATENLSEAAGRLRDSGADEMVTTLADAIAQFTKLSPASGLQMIPAPIPADEEERQAALASLDVVNGEGLPAIDRLTARLTRIFEVPIALVTLVDHDRQFFKAQTGLPADLVKARQTPRDVSVCGHVIAGNQPLVVEDLARDHRFANNPFLKEHGLRFYAGIPLRAPNGQPIGSLCLLDTKPRRFGEREQRLLQEYANEVMDELANRRGVALAAQ